MQFLQNLETHLHKHPGDPVLFEMQGSKQVSITGRSLTALIAAGRGTLQGHGIKQGDRVVLVAPNSARWVAADIAILAEGAICVPMYARQCPDELVEMMHDCEPRAVICATEEIAESIRQRWGRAPLITFNAFFPTRPADGSADTIPFHSTPFHQGKSSDPVTIIYTSGTSGAAKGVVLTRSNVDHMLPVTSTALTELMKGEPEPHRVFHYLPLCFAGSRMVLWTQLYRGNPIWLSTNLDNLKDEMTAAKPHYALNVPVMLERIRDGVEKNIRARGGLIHKLWRSAKAAHTRIREGNPRRGDRWLHRLAERVLFQKIRPMIGPNLKAFICGSAPLSPETQRWFEMLQLPVLQVYGLTETTAIVTMDRPGLAEPGRVGVPIEGCETRIDEDGELWVKGPHIFAGYWNQKDATREAFRDGWFQTGDAADKDEQGRIRIIGRTKNILVPNSGHNVAPEPIEDKLKDTIEGVEHAVVFGHGKPFLSAVLSGSNLDASSAEKALEQINASLPHYRRIRKIHITRDELTPENGLLTANQKLKRRALEQHFKDALDQIYA